VCIIQVSATTWVEFRETMDDEEAFRRFVCGIRGIEPGESSTQERKDRVRYRVVIDCTVDDIDQVRIRSILECLRMCSGDASLTLKELREGSVRLLLEGSLIGFERLRFLFSTGQLHAILGESIRGLEPEPDLEKGRDDASGHHAPRLPQPHGEPASVVVVSPSQDDARHLSQMLGGMLLRVEHVPTISYFRVRVKRRRYDVVVTEATLPLGGHPNPAIEGHFKTGQR
jgi:hypothetical protein